MHCLLALMLAVRVDDVIYTAEFSRHAVRPDTFFDGDQVAAEVRDGKMMVKRKDGKIVSGRVIWEQRTLVHPTPEP